METELKEPLHHFGGTLTTDVAWDDGSPAPRRIADLFALAAREGRRSAALGGPSAGAPIEIEARLGEIRRDMPASANKVEQRKWEKKRARADAHRFVPRISRQRWEELRSAAVAAAATAAPAGASGSAASGAAIIRRLPSETTVDTFFPHPKGDVRVTMVIPVHESGTEIAPQDRLWRVKEVCRKMQVAVDDSGGEHGPRTDVVDFEWFRRDQLVSAQEAGVDPTAFAGLRVSCKAEASLAFAQPGDEGYPYAQACNRFFSPRLPPGAWRSALLSGAELRVVGGCPVKLEEDERGKKPRRLDSLPPGVSALTRLARAKDGYIPGDIAAQMRWVLAMAPAAVPAPGWNAVDGGSGGGGGGGGGRGGHGMIAHENDELDEDDPFAAAANEIKSGGSGGGEPNSVSPPVAFLPLPSAGLTAGQGSGSAALPMALAARDNVGLRKDPTWMRSPVAVASAEGCVDAVFSAAAKHKESSERDGVKGKGRSVDKADLTSGALVRIRCLPCDARAVRGGAAVSLPAMSVTALVPAAALRPTRGSAAAIEFFTRFPEAGGRGDPSPRLFRLKERESFEIVSPMHAIAAANDDGDGGDSDDGDDGDNEKESMRLDLTAVRRSGFDASALLRCAAQVRSTFLRSTR